MKIKVNGETKQLAEGLSVRGLLDELGLTRGPVAVERNGEVVARAEHGRTELREGDAVEIVHFVGGG